MTPEARAHLDTAEPCLTKARAGLRAAVQEPTLAENAARDAYYAAFLAAHALIVERTGKEPKTHSGVHRLFHRETLNEPSVPQELRDFIIRAYDFKATADYATSPALRTSPDRAAGAIATAEQFVTTVASLLPP